jgi:hypothetical protein
MDKRDRKHNFCSLVKLLQMQITDSIILNAVNLPLYRVPRSGREEVSESFLAGFLRSLLRTRRLVFSFVRESFFDRERLGMAGISESVCSHETAILR